MDVNAVGLAVGDAKTVQEVRVSWVGHVKNVNGAGHGIHNETAVASSIVSRNLTRAFTQSAVVLADKRPVNVRVAHHVELVAAIDGEVCTGV